MWKIEIFPDPNKPDGLNLQALATDPQGHKEAAAVGGALLIHFNAIVEDWKMIRALDE